MFQPQKTISKLIVGALSLVLTIASAADAQQGYFEGHYVGVGEAAGAAITLVQRGQQVAGRLVIDGTAFAVEAWVSGTSGQGVAGNPHSGAVQPFGLSLVGGGLVITVPEPAGGGQVFQFQRGGGGGASPSRGSGVFEDKVADICARMGGC